MENDYEVLGRLGEGSFGKVYKARHRRTGEICAVKQIKIGSRSWDEACRSTELQALRALRHPFIVRLRELIRSQWDGSLYYIFEFLDSDLCRLVKENSSGLDEMRAADLIRQLFAGLAHMHQHNFFHRDIKPENVLLDAGTVTIRIADLGQARSLRSRPPFTDYVGTRWYRAPECLLRDRTYSSPVDIWASGLIFAELLRGSPIFCGTSTIDQLYKIFTVLGTPLHDWPDFARLAQAVRFRVPNGTSCGLGRVLPNSTSPQVQAVLSDFLQLNPRRRPLARKCLEHSFFTQLPALDLDRMDTHRSRTSSEKIEEKAVEKEEELPISARLPTEAASSARAEVASDLDLDAELDAILGDGGGPTAAAYASDAGGDSLGLGTIAGLESSCGDAVSTNDAAHPSVGLDASASTNAQMPVPPVPPLRVPQGPEAAPPPVLETGALPPPSAREQPSVSRASSFDFVPDSRAGGTGPEAAAAAPEGAEGLRIETPARKIAGSIRDSPLSPKSPGSVSVDALLDSLCADFPETSGSPNNALDSPVAGLADNQRAYGSPREDGWEDEQLSATQPHAEAEVLPELGPPEPAQLPDQLEPLSAPSLPDIEPPKVLPEGRPVELPEEILPPPMPPPALPLPSTSDPMYTGLTPVSGKLAPAPLESPRRSCSPAPKRAPIELEAHPSTPACVRRAVRAEPVVVGADALTSPTRPVLSVETAWPGTPAAAAGNEGEDEEEANKSPTLWEPLRRQVTARQSVPALSSSKSSPSLSSSRRRQTQARQSKATTIHLPEHDKLPNSNVVSPSSESSKAASEAEVVLPGLEEGRHTPVSGLGRIGEEPSPTPADLCRTRSAVAAWNPGDAPEVAEAEVRPSATVSASKFLELAAAAPVDSSNNAADRACTAGDAGEAAMVPEVGVSEAVHADGTAKVVIRASAAALASAVVMAAEDRQEEHAHEPQLPTGRAGGRLAEDNSVEGSPDGPAGRSDTRDHELEALRAENVKLRGLLTLRAADERGREGAGSRESASRNLEVTSSQRLPAARAPAWTAEEAAQLRRVVKRIIRRGTREKDALWAEVSSELGSSRSAKECKLQYARDYRAHKAKTSETCQAELAGESVTCAPPSGGFRGTSWGNDSGALTGATGNSQRHFQLRTPSLPEPLFRTGVAVSQVAM